MWTSYNMENFQNSDFTWMNFFLNFYRKFFLRDMVLLPVAVAWIVSASMSHSVDVVSWQSVVLILLRVYKNGLFGTRCTYALDVCYIAKRWRFLPKYMHRIKLYFWNKLTSSYRKIRQKLLDFSIYSFFKCFYTAFSKVHIIYMEYTFTSVFPINVKK